MMMSATERFPIPMRGNELTDVGELQEPLKFPIPMRGNETLYYSRFEFTTPVPDPHEG